MGCGMPRYRWEINIQINLRDMECEGVDWIHLTNNRNYEHGNKPSGSMNEGNVFDHLSDC
jgi:hypothetical protein